ncbi:MAG: LytTR family transcriptional regulator DNA-binding domain-containing protein [Saprospiraceae bacterium]|nr:LytTR family transcriptional regulator DNA-binding domain-containing protein [Saprospiraceae bacterium]
MNQPAAHIKVITHSGCEIIQSSRVNFIEAHSNYSTLHLSDKRILTSKTLKYWFVRLDHSMIRCHRTYCVHKDSIVAFNRAKSLLVLSNGTRIPVSRNCRKKIHSMLQSGHHPKGEVVHPMTKNNINPIHRNPENP